MFVKQAFLLTLCLAIVQISQQSSDTCYIINKAATKPYPSLIQCYKNNPSSCCNSMADQYINNQYALLLSDSCQRSYSYLEAYFCYACDSSEPTYTDRSTMKIKICKSFLENIWQADLNGPSTVFDECGMTSIWDSSDSTSVVLPSEKFSTAYDFVYKLKPPFFKDYFVTVVDNNQGCYSSSEITQVSLLALSILCILILLL